MIETPHYPALSMACICMLAAGFLAGGSQPEKGFVPRLCFGKKLAANVPNV